jgi:hypothetical protein
MQHVLQIRIVDRYKFEALEYETLELSPTGHGMVKKKQNFFYFALKFENAEVAFPICSGGCNTNH